MESVKDTLEEMKALKEQRQESIKGLSIAIVDDMASEFAFELQEN